MAKEVMERTGELSTEGRVELLRTMLLGRRFEERCAEMYALQKIGGFCHLGIGQEAASVGAISTLQPDDYIFASYRDHVHALAKGSDPGRLMAELFGRETGVSRGKGFAGVMKRHHFKGAVRTHGAHEYKRHGGSIGTNMTPGRTLPGKRMPGQMGNEQVTVMNQRIAKLVPEQNLILIEGGIPGAPQTLIAVRGAVRRSGGKPKA